MQATTQLTFEEGTEINKGDRVIMQVTTGDDDRQMAFDVSGGVLDRDALVLAHEGQAVGRLHTDDPLGMYDVEGLIGTFEWDGQGPSAFGVKSVEVA